MKKSNTHKYKSNFLGSTQFDRTAADIGILRKDQINEPAEERTIGEFVNARWARFFDQNSTFLYELRQLTQNSSTLGRILEDKARMVMGAGFNVVESSGGIPMLASFRKLLQKLTGSETQAEQINEIISRVNMHGETLEEVGYKLAYDQGGFGNAMAELTKTTKDGQPVVYLNHIPLEYTAIEKENDFGVSEHIAVSKYWVRGQIPNESQMNIIKVYPEFSEFQTDSGTYEKSIIHIKNYLPGFEYWGLPSWIAARYWAELEYRIPKYNISKFKNGFMPSSIVQFFGAATQEEARKLIDDFRACFTDTGNNNKVMAQVLRDERFKAIVTPINDTSEGNYMQLSDLAAQQIVTAMRWTMALAGHATAGQLGTNQQLRDELELINNMCIKPMRSLLLSRIFNPFLKEYAKHTNNNTLDKCYLTIANMNPISYASSISVETNLTTTEKREALGYDALKEEQINEQNALNNANTNSTNTGTGSN